MASPLYARLVPGGTAFNGVFATACSGPILFYPTFTRCTCFDGNLVDGDGCDASCQTEACFTCSGDPSVCAPTPDGQACDDRRDCTSGETCAAGVCGGGAPVTPCIDMTGSWHVVETIDGLGLSEEYDRDFTQRGGIVRTPGYIGTIDPAAGVFVLVGAVRPASSSSAARRPRSYRSPARSASPPSPAPVQDDRSVDVLRPS